MPHALPDLAALVAKPASELRSLSRLYDADRGACGENTICRPTRETTPGSRILPRLASQAVTALGRIRSQFREQGGVERTPQANRRDADELDDNYRKRTEVAPLVAFPVDIFDLEESRRRLDPIDPVQLAAQLSELRSKIDQNANVQRAKSRKETSSWTSS